jgi:hypothetical protein
MKHRRTGRLTTLLGLVLLIGLALPTAVHADGEPPLCDGPYDGDFWQDPESGQWWECVFDFTFRWIWVDAGGPPADFSNTGVSFSSPTLGCVLNTARIGGGGAWSYAGTSMVQSLFGGYDGDGNNCDYQKSQPPGELRSRSWILRWNGSAWVACRDTGYVYNQTSAWSYVGSFNMGSVADCGSAYYLNRGYGSIFEGGGWWGTYIHSPYMWIP